MGLSPTHSQAEEQQRLEQEQVMDDEEVKQVKGEPESTASSEQADKFKDEQKPYQIQTQNELELKAPPHATCSLRDATDDVAGCSCMCTRSLPEPLSTDLFLNKLKKLRESCGDEGMMTFKINSIFFKRLKDIDCMDQQGSGDSLLVQQLRLATYQDWVDMLMHVNQVLLGNMPAVELEAYKKTVSCFQSVRGEQHDVLDENRKIRKDMCAIIRLVQEAYHRSNWNTDDITLETMTVDQLLGTQADQCRPESEVTKCMKSLANEMAAKHDEVCYLKAQMGALDEVVQTARQKIILKDKCIAQLNQQLTELQDCLSKMTQDSNKARIVDALDYNGDFDNMDYTSCLFDGLSEKEKQASELLRMLNRELAEFIDLISKKDFAAMESRRKILSCLFDRINSNRAETLQKLDNLRGQLRNLDCNWSQLDIPLACSTQATDDDMDRQLIDGLRRRLYSMNEANKELNNRCQLTEVEILELRCTSDNEHSISLKNQEVLRQIADLLSKLQCSNLTDEEMDTEMSTNNPYCMGILKMYEKLKTLESNQEQQHQMLTTDIGADCPHRQQLEHTLLHCQTQSEILQATRDNYLSIIEEFRRDLEELTEQVEQQQQQQQQQQQNELLANDSEQCCEEPSRIGVNKLEQQNEELVCQILGLQNALADRDHRIEELQSTIDASADETCRVKNQIRALEQMKYELSQKVVKISSLLKVQEEEQQNLYKNYDDLENSFEEQSKALKRANRIAQSLEDRLGQVEKQQDELKAERNLLREEIISLKEKDAQSTGRERALNEQLRACQQEVDKARCLRWEMRAQFKREKAQDKDMLDGLVRANEDIRMEIRAAHCRCKEMQIKLNQQQNVTEQQQLIIDTFRNWKDAQVRSDEAMRQCIQRHKEHINMLMEQSHHQCDEYQRLFRDYRLLDVELRRVKNAVDGRLSSTNYDHPSAVVQRGQEVHDDMTNRLRLMCVTSQRLTEQNRALNDGKDVDPNSGQSPQRFPGGGSQQSHPAPATLQTHRT
ncbi:GH13126 [Drosophila grimshawi]|uniref:GH13126 n=1 Tax=Drosophila grimshawi TaxID=7222 RepID=B4JQS8_DROGR|nr:GH13126 [Drosophila grimshawi]